MTKRNSKHYITQSEREPLAKSKPTSPGALAPVIAGTGFPVWLLAGLLVLVTVALFWPATRCDFVNYDDPDYVTSNVHVQSGLTWENVKWSFINPVSANWHPLTVLSHMLVCQVFGLQPAAHHFINVLLHAINAGLVFVLLRQLTGATWRSLFVAALFAVHPLRVESAAWVAERKDVLSGFFGLLALIFYARYAQSKSGKRKAESGNYLLSLGFLALGLMSKPMLVTWPFVMLLLDYWPLERFKVQRLGFRVQDLVWEKIPFFALAGAASVATLVAQKGDGSLAMGESVPLGARVGNALVSYCRHLGNLIWPKDLAVFYPHSEYWPLAEVLLAGGCLGGISVVLLVRRRQWPFLLVGWLWFLGTLVPVIGLVPAAGQTLCDHHTYLPSLGVLILIVWGAHALTRRWRHQVMMLSVAGSAAIVLCTVLTRQQLGYWQNSETLFKHALGVTEDNYVAYDGLGNVFLNNGQFDKAISQFQEALRLKPNNEETHNNFGKALLNKDLIDAAIGQFQEALRLRPDYADAFNNFGTALLKQGQDDEAISQYREALRLEPKSAGLHNNLGIALEKKGQSDEAIRQYQEAIRLGPDFAPAYNNLGFLWARRGENLDQARAMIERAAQLNPKNATYLDSLGWVLFKLNRPREALEYLLQAVANSSRPDASLYDHLGDVYAALHQSQQAVGAWRQSLAVESNPEIQKKLDALSAH